MITHHVFGHGDMQEWADRLADVRDAILGEFGEAHPFYEEWFGPTVSNPDAVVEMVRAYIQASHYSKSADSSEAYVAGGQGVLRADLPGASEGKASTFIHNDDGVSSFGPGPKEPMLADVPIRQERGHVRDTPLYWVSPTERRFATAVETAVRERITAMEPSDVQTALGLAPSGLARFLVQPRWSIATAIRAADALGLNPLDYGEKGGE